MAFVNAAVRRVLAVEILVALHVQTVAALLGLEPVRRAGKAWAASAARRYKARAAQTVAQRIAR